MYPVLSVLRRASAHHIYVHKGMLLQKEEGFFIRLETPSSRVLLETGKWSSVMKEIPLSILQVTGASSLSVATSLTKKENELAEQFRAEDAMYTLVLGPEDEVVEGEKVVRRVRLAIIRGVYRVTEGRFVPMRAQNPAKAQFSKRPRGSITLD